MPAALTGPPAPRSAAKNDPSCVFDTVAPVAAAAAADNDGDNDAVARPVQTGGVRSLAHRSTVVDGVPGTDGLGLDVGISVASVIRTAQPARGGGTLDEDVPLARMGLGNAPRPLPLALATRASSPPETKNVILYTRA